jgi:hypothetical protein
MYTEGKAASYDRHAGMVAGAGAIGQDVRQSEIDREVFGLRRAAENLDAMVAKVIGKVEKVTRDQQPTSATDDKAACPPTPQTALGRELNELNSRIDRALWSLGSVVQRIEL